MIENDLKNFCIACDDCREDGLCYKHLVNIKYGLKNLLERCEKLGTYKQVITTTEENKEIDEMSVEDTACGADYEDLYGRQIRSVGEYLIKNADTLAAGCDSSVEGIDIWVNIQRDGAPQIRVERNINM